MKEETGKQETVRHIVLSIPNRSCCNCPVARVISEKENMYMLMQRLRYEVWLDRRGKGGGLRHLVLLCTRPLAPALSVSSVDP